MKQESFFWDLRPEQYGQNQHHYINIYMYHYVANVQYVKSHIDVQCNELLYTLLLCIT